MKLNVLLLVLYLISICLVLHTWKNLNENIWLQDQYDNLSTHTHKGIEFLDKFGQFIKDRCAIEIEYASKLRRLVKNHQIKKKDDDDNQSVI